MVLGLTLSVGRATEYFFAHDPLQVSLSGRLSQPGNLKKESLDLGNQREDESLLSIDLILGRQVPVSENPQDKRRPPFMKCKMGELIVDKIGPGEKKHFKFAKIYKPNKKKLSLTTLKPNFYSSIFFLMSPLQETSCLRKRTILSTSPSLTTFLI